MSSVIHAQLTSRETDVLRALLEDRTMSQAAQNLGMKPATAQTHLRNMHRKTKTHTAHGLVSWAMGHARCCIAATG